VSPNAVVISDPIVKASKVPSLLRHLPMEEKKEEGAGLVWESGRVTQTRSASGSPSL